MLALAGNSAVVWFEGNYQADIEDLKKRKGASADHSHRINYKAVVRGLDYSADHTRAAWAGCRACKAIELESPVGWCLFVAA
jgi:hypothetical protein